MSYFEIGEWVRIDKSGSKWHGTQARVTDRMYIIHTHTYFYHGEVVEVVDEVEVVHTVGWAVPIPWNVNPTP